MKRTLQGIGVSRGVAMGNTHLLQRGHIEVSLTHIDTSLIESETNRYLSAINAAKAQLRKTRKQIPPTTRSDILAFIETHLLMLDDTAFMDVPISMIKEKLYNAESALQIQRDAMVKVFDAMEDPYLRTRKDDVDHVVNLIFKGLLGKEDQESINKLQGQIILARDLSPADTILLKHQGIAAFITESGGPMSHTAILARSLGIPAVVGVHNATQYLNQGEFLIVDGSSGEVISDADQATLLEYQQRIRDEETRSQRLLRLIGKRTITKDGEDLRVMANIELPEDIETTLALQADGVGLYRTEFLFMNRENPPDEDDHYDAYRSVVEGLNGIPVTIRTLDLGADKQTDGYPGLTPVCNPALGLRAIRLCLKQPALFLPQIRAILRASAHGPVRMMIPMLSTLDEVQQLMTHVEHIREELRREKIPFDENLPIGGMIEVPAAALSASGFASMLDFLSIGTNDLIQYTLAIDRIDDEVNYLYDPIHPAVLRLIKMVIDAGQRQNKPISMCGEMAGDPEFIPLLLGMGLRKFSMQPGAILGAKERLSQLDTRELRKKTEYLFRYLDDPDFPQYIRSICESIH